MEHIWSIYGALGGALSGALSEALNEKFTVWDNTDID
jgi:hypothetical protein